jgi:hypothetical protein
MGICFWNAHSNSNDVESKCKYLITFLDALLKMFL